MKTLLLATMVVAAASGVARAQEAPGDVTPPPAIAPEPVTELARPPAPPPPPPPPIVAAAAPASRPVTPARTSEPPRPAATAWKSAVGFFGAVRWVSRGVPMPGVATSASGEAYGPERASATPNLLLGMHARRFTLALSVHYSSTRGEDADYSGKYRFLGAGLTLACQVAESAGERVQLHVFGSMVYGSATVSFGYDGAFDESSDAWAEVVGGALGVLGRGYLMPMVALEAGAALDFLDFDVDDSLDSLTIVQLIAFVGLAFAS